MTTVACEGESTHPSVAAGISKILQPTGDASFRYVQEAIKERGPFNRESRKFLSEDDPSCRLEMYRNALGETLCTRYISRYVDRHPFPSKPTGEPWFTVDTMTSKMKLHAVRKGIEEEAVIFSAKIVGLSLDTISGIQTAQKRIDQAKGLALIQFFENIRDSLPDDVQRSLDEALKDAQALRGWCHKNGEVLAQVERVVINCAELSALPEEISFFSGLLQLALLQNNLRGLPPEVCQLSKLVDLRLGSNLLQFLPGDLHKLKDLVSLDISYNPDLKELPMQEPFPNLGQLVMDGTPLEVFPYKLTQCLRLRDVSYNCLPKGAMFADPTVCHYIFGAKIPDEVRKAIAPILFDITGHGGTKILDRLEVSGYTGDTILFEVGLKEWHRRFCEKAFEALYEAGVSEGYDTSHPQFGEKVFYGELPFDPILRDRVLKAI